MMQILLFFDRFFTKFFAKFWGSLTFYTILPIPQTWAIAFDGIAGFAPLVGVLIGGLLGFITLSLNYLGMPLLTSSAVSVGLWILITGGLHLDGVMDTADGLATTDRDRRLEVMADSKTGAFGVMAGAVIILLKTSAIYDLTSQFMSRDLYAQITYIFVMMSICGWARWGQLWAVLRYPYLRSQGKGAFHKESITSIKDLVPSTLLLILVAIAQILIDPREWILVILVFSMGIAIGTLIGAWFDHKLSGHTGDTYGAVVEWTEALMLCGVTIIIR